MTTPVPSKLTPKIVHARVTVWLDTGQTIEIELESTPGFSIEGHLNTETEAIEDEDESWARGHRIRKPGRSFADIALKGVIR
jgi:hypothetical protein